MCIYVWNKSDLPSIAISVSSDLKSCEASASPFWKCSQQTQHQYAVCTKTKTILAWLCDDCAMRDSRLLHPTAKTVLAWNSTSAIDHPTHYGGADNPYEAVKVITAWSLNFALGNAVKYICRAGKKAGADELEDLKKAAWYLNHEIERRTREGDKCQP